MACTLHEFWVPRFRGLSRPTAGLPLTGWSVEPAVNPYFVEADLKLREALGDLASPIWFVAAPGAVGKSTLAREISARTGAVYLDLAKADTVAGYYLSGGLDRNGLSAAWDRGEVAVLIDALDEARMRVPEESFRDFLRDVLEKSRERRVPTVLFGRMGVVEDAQEILFYEGWECPILDVGFFDAARAGRFILGALERLKSLPAYKGLEDRLRTHPDVYRGVANRFVEKLTIATAADGTKFAGYAPVLEAVANVLAGISNLAKLQEVPDSLQHKALSYLTVRVMEREAEKLREQIVGIPDGLRETLYTPREQLGRLIAKVLGTSEPPMPPELPPQLVGTYERAFRSILEQHPFLDGTGRGPSGVVFAAVILAAGLHSPASDVKAAAARYVRRPPQTPNPFLIDFYLQAVGSAEREVSLVEPEHVVLLHESMQARAGAEHIVQLSVEGDGESDEAEVEILQIDAEVQDPSSRILSGISLRTTQAGVLRFGRRISQVTVDAPQIDVVIGDGTQVEVVAPVAINAARLTFDCPELVVAKGERRAGGGDGTVILEATELRESKVQRAPIVREGATLQVSWPGAAVYPWSSFQADASATDEPDVHDALTRLRRLLLAFRSHGRGQLGRYRHKIEHARITKGALGEAIRARLMRDKILSFQGNMYFLDSDRLGQVCGVAYQDLKLKRFSQTVREYLASIVRNC